MIQVVQNSHSAAGSACTGERARACVMESHDSIAGPLSHETKTRRNCRRNNRNIKSLGLYLHVECTCFLFGEPGWINRCNNRSRPATVRSKLRCTAPETRVYVSAKLRRSPGPNYTRVCKCRRHLRGVSRVVCTALRLPRHSSSSLYCCCCAPPTSFSLLFRARTRSNLHQLYIYTRQIFPIRIIRTRTH